MLVTNEDQWNEAMAYIGEHDAIVMDTETNGLVWYRDQAVSVQIGAGEREFYFPFRHGEGPNLPELKLKHLATEVLRPDRLHIGFHYAFDIKMMAKEGMVSPLQMRDPMLAAHLMNENEDSFKMEGLAARYFDASYADAEEELLDTITSRLNVARKGAKSHLWKLPATLTERYGLQDIRTTRELDRFYAPHIETWKMSDVAEGVYGFQLALVDMEKRGLLIDQEALQRLDAEASPKEQELERRIQEWARADLNDPEFPANPRSPAQMKLWLSQTIGATGTSKPVLQLLDEERGNLLLEYRVWQKLKSSFIDPYYGYIAPDGAIHPHLWITSPGTRKEETVHGTKSSRLSATQPNMQQVPDAVRKVVIARPGHTLVEFDYSQAELRLGAHYHAVRFGKLELGRILLAGEDMHQKTADATGVVRKVAKNGNFAIEYGAGAERLSATMNIPVNAARRYRNTYWKLFPGSRLLMNQAAAEAEARGYIRLWTGRVLHFNSIRTPSKDAKNRLIQGGVAEMLRVVITQLFQEVPEALMLLTVHDSILFEIPTHILTETIQKIRTIMQWQPWCTLPMVVDVKVGPNWGEMTALDRDPTGIPPDVLAVTTDPTLHFR